MKRDIHLVKEIFAFLETSDSVMTELQLGSDSPFQNYNDNAVSYHIHLLREADYIQGDLTITDKYVQTLERGRLRLTWQGHEFYEILKDKEVLHKITSLSKDGFTSMSFTIIKDLAKKMIENKAEKLLGLTT